MKNIFTLGLLAVSAFGFSQSISTKEGNEKFTTGSQNAVITTILENNASDVIDSWKKIMKDYKNEKVKESDGEVFGDNILVKEWGNNTVDFYARFEENKKDKTVRMSVAVDLGGTYLSSSTDKDKFRYVEKMVKEFAIKMTKAPIEEAIKVNEKKLAKLEDNQKDLEKDKKNLQEDIEDYKKKISKTEKDIAAKDGDIGKKKSEVDAQKKVVNASSGTVSEQSNQKAYDKLAGELKDLEKDKKGMEKDIENYQGKIKKAEADIKKNDEDQVKKKQEIEDQKKVVDDVKKKLNGVN